MTSDPKAEAHLRKVDPLLAKMIDQVGPCEDTPATHLSHFEALARAVVYQQLSGKAAATIYGRFEALCNGAGVVPAAVMGLSDEQLRAAGLSRQKTASLKDFATKCLESVVLIDRLHELPDEEIISELTQVRGIGLWTAQMFLMFRLGRPDVLPHLDLGIRKGLQKTYGLDDLPTPQQVLELGEKWRPHCTLACWYLWRSLEIQLLVPV
jgi:DNA-3-methyladenine glycosylase II